MSDKYRPNIDQAQRISPKMSDNWPKHEDGTNKMIGDMTAEERSKVLQAAAARYRAKMNTPIQKRLADDFDKIFGVEQSS